MYRMCVKFEKNLVDCVWEIGWTNCLKSNFKNVLKSKHFQQSKISSIKLDTVSLQVVKKMHVNFEKALGE